MKPVSVKEYIEYRKQIEPLLNVEKLESAVYGSIRYKLEGYVCRQCQGELWAVGVALTDDFLCRDCIGVESNSENDIEFDLFFEKLY